MDNSGNRIEIFLIQAKVRGIFARDCGTDYDPMHMTLFFILLFFLSLLYISGISKW